MQRSQSDWWGGVGWPGTPTVSPARHLSEDLVKETQGSGASWSSAGKPILGKVAEGSGTRHLGQERSRKQCSHISCFDLEGLGTVACKKNALSWPLPLTRGFSEAAQSLG